MKVRGSGYVTSDRICDSGYVPSAAVQLLCRLRAHIPESGMNSRRFMAHDPASGLNQMADRHIVRRIGIVNVGYLKIGHW